MIGAIIAGGVAVVLLAAFAAAFIRLLWLSIPYEDWVNIERDRRRRQAERKRRRARRKRG